MILEYQEPNTISLFTLYSLPRPELGLCCYSHSKSHSDGMFWNHFSNDREYRYIFLIYKAFFYRKIKIIFILFLSKEKQMVMQKSSTVNIQLACESTRRWPELFLWFHMLCPKQFLLKWMLVVPLSRYLNLIKVLNL